MSKKKKKKNRFRTNGGGTTNLQIANIKKIEHPNNIWSRPWEPLTIFARISILNVWLGSECSYLLLAVFSHENVFLLCFYHSLLRIAEMSSNIDLMIEERTHPRSGLDTIVLLCRMLVHVAPYSERKDVKSIVLTHFMPLVSFYLSWKHQKIRGFLMFLEGYRNKLAAWNELTL